jgi:hypothetical protein
MARLNPFDGYLKPTKSRFSRSQKTVEKTVKPLETGGNVQTSANELKQGKTATAASQGHRASAGGRMGLPKKARGAGLSPASPNWQSTFDTLIHHQQGSCVFL